MSRSTRLLWALLACALVPRVALVFLVPEIWADGYSHMMMAWGIAEHGIHPAQMAGYKLPFYPVAAGLAVRLIGDPAIGTRLLTVLFGAATIPLAFALARRVFPEHRTAAWTAAVLVFIAPSHLLFSSFAMTECVIGALEVAAVWALVRAERTNKMLLWMAAALAVAALTRYEIWPLALGMWILALVQRRATVAVAAAAAAILAVPPLLWMAINYAGTGNPLYFMTSVSGYMENMFYAMYPEAARRDPATTLRYIGKLVPLCGAAILPALLGGYLAARTRAGRTLLISLLMHSATLLVLYLTRIQAGWDRYWIPLMPFFFVLAGSGIERLSSFGSRRLLIPGLVSLCVLSFTPVVVAYLPHAHSADHTRQIGRELRGTSGIVYCDEPAVSIAAGPPLERYIGSWVIRDLSRSAALERLRAERVEWFVWTGVDYSPVHRLFPELGTPQSTEEFELIFVPPATDWILKRGLKPSYLYRLKKR